jgi:DnaJ domain/Domain of unknown function (DUF4388)
LNGLLTEGVLPTLLRELYVKRHTGVLRLKQDAVERRMYFREGHAVNASSSLPEEHMGERMVSQGLLTQIDLARATDLVVKTKVRLGQALHDLGAMEPDQLESALADHVCELVRKVCESPDGEWTFEEQPAGPTPSVALKVSTAELILGAVRRIEDPDSVRFGLGNQDRILALATDPTLRFPKVEFTPTDGYVLSRVDGTLSAREIAQMIPLPTEDVERSLLGLLCTGAIEYSSVPPKKPAARPVAATTAMPPNKIPAAAGSSAAAASGPAAVAAQAQPVAQPAKAAAAPVVTTPTDVEARRQEIAAAFDSLKGRSHFDVLAISKASNEAQVKEAYFRLARRFHPDSIRKEVALADLAERAEAVFIRIGEAYEVLRDTRRRSSYEADLASRTPRPGPQAASSATAAAPAGALAPADPEAEARAVENAIRVAERHVAEEKYWDAIQVLEVAVPLATGKASLRARYVLAKALVKNPHWIKRAEELLQGLVKDEPMHLGAHLQLGHIYKGGGLKARAGSMYRRVLELQPGHEEATLGLRDLAPPPEAEAEAEPPAGGGRLLKRFFNKN